jgi:hypothetical protein
MLRKVGVSTYSVADASKLGTVGSGTNGLICGNVPLLVSVVTVKLLLLPPPPPPQAVNAVLAKRITRHKDFFGKTFNICTT